MRYPPAGREWRRDLSPVSVVDISVMDNIGVGVNRWVC